MPVAHDDRLVGKIDVGVTLPAGPDIETTRSAPGQR